MPDKITWKIERKRISRILAIYFIVFFIVLAFVGGFVYGRYGQDPLLNIGVTENTQINFPNQAMPDIFKSDLLKVIWKHLQDGYLYKDQIDHKKMYYSAIQGFVAGAGDQFTTFFTPEETKQFNEVISGEFEGIGAEIGMKNDMITVIAPLPGSPAEKAGLMTNDIIYAIDKIDTTGMTVETAVKMIRGPKGTTVTLSILRNDGETKEITITRDSIELKSVNWEFRKDGLAYLKISGFHEDTDSLFDQFVKELKTKKIKGIIVDLRGNPGGLLSSANYITSAWLKNNDVVVIERFSDRQQEIYRASGNGELLGIPTVVLINGGSASGSEILAGALKDHKKATLIGEKTFGKGSVQEMRSLPDGSSLKITIAEWFTPNGGSINKTGIEPDVKVNFTIDDYKAKKDPQLDKAVSLLLNK